MEKHVMKIFTPVFALLLVVSLLALPTATVSADQNNQEKAMKFMEKVLPIDLTKYTVNLISDFTMDGVPLADDHRKINNLLYELVSEKSKLQVSFGIENGIMTSCHVYSLEGQIITNKPYTGSLDVAKNFLRTYQEYTKIDSNNLIAMLDNINLKENSITTVDNTQLKVLVDYILETEQTILRWEHIINGASYGILEIIVDEKCFISAVMDTRALYTTGDTSVNISEEQAIKLALENLKTYYYEMPDGSIVKDFAAQRDAVVARLVTSSVDYELRPYWDVRIILDKVYPGNVHGITVLIWANNGDIIECSNMAFGGTYDIDGTTSPDNSLVFVLAAVVVVVVVALAVGLAVKKKHR